MTTWAEIDLGTAKNNAAHIKEIAGKDVTIAAVVKADAYSHGALELADAFLKGGATFLAVATVCEGIELRSSHIDAPVIIFNPPLPDELNKILEYGLTPVVDNLKICELLNVVANPNGRKVKIHIEVDTGMGRNGFFPGEVVSKIKMIKQLKNIIIEGIFTHFPSAENDRDFTMKQIAEFKQVLGELDSAGINIPYRHCANSAGVLAFPESFFNMVRPGLCLYGISPFTLSAPSMQTRRGLIHQTRGSDKSDPYKKNFTKPVLTLKSRIVHKREVPRGTPLSYGRTHITTRKSCIATLPIGYADGYSRNLSNKAEVLVRGKRVPVAGRICMDRCLIDITDMPEAKVGDEVVLIGKQENELISVEELAQKAETIPHEFISRIGRRVPRIYRRNEK